MALTRRPEASGLYDPAMEHDSCGVGFVANIKGVRSHQLIEDALNVLWHMDHRGAVGAEKNTGDGAGILTALPWEFLEKVAKRDAGLTLPAKGKYAAGMVFLPKKDAERAAAKKRCEELVARFGQKLIGWRTIPVNNADLGPTAKASEPVMEMIFVENVGALSEEAFDRKLWLIRKRATHEIHGIAGFDSDSIFYIASLSSRIMVYKGMLTPAQVMNYFPDIHDPDFTTHLAMVHSRFSTNTFPSWDRAQPLRFMSHNGEINTLRGNVNKMKSRQGQLISELFGDELRDAYPIIEPDLSDSGAFDNVLELLIMAGRSMPEAMMMMVPEAWQNHKTMDKKKKSFYRYHSHIMEPWDGPASLVFTDGRYIGACLDRNGLRPSRFYVTTDDVVIMASEVGVLDVPADKVKTKGRLQPGKMFLVDFSEGRIIADAELKEKYASSHPYEQWLEKQEMHLSELKTDKEPHGFNGDTVLKRMRAFGYTYEHCETLLRPMVENSQEPLGSMGNDAALAVLSDKPRLVYDYFKQIFAQVTNPPIDSIREEIIMSLECMVGPEKNLLSGTEDHCHRLLIPSPILTNEQLAALKHMNHRGWKTKTIDITFPVSEGEAGFKATFDRIAQEAESAITEGYSLVLLSDRNVSRERVHVSALLAVGAVHQHLVRAEKRTQIGIIVESGEPREVHHFCTLVGFGADAVNPYLAFEAMWHMNRNNVFTKEISDGDIVAHYIKAMMKGMRKVMGKMGISTLESYKGAQIFEAIGLDSEVVKTCFTGTVSRIKGSDFTVLAAEAFRRHELGFPKGNSPQFERFVSAGDYHVRNQGEKHMWDPESIADLQRSVRYDDHNAWKRFSDRQNARETHQATLRGLLKFRDGAKAIPLDQVEPVTDIVKRFVTGAMSYGSISIEAHETIAIAMNRLGGKSNTGEGGEDPSRFKRLSNGDSLRSAIKQIASGRFGVTIEYLTNADELQIKMAQGAKPGEGGELPGHKVDAIIAKTRYSTQGVGLISPPPHHDIYSIEDLAQLIFDLKNSNPKARISVKLVSEVGVGTIAAGVAKGHADHILISGHDGGTGASPLTGVKYAGLPWELGIAETHQTLVMNDLRGRVMLQTDGQLKTGRDVVIGAILGAEEFGFSTAPLITLGCIMMRKCHNNTCPVGIATQNPVLRARFAGKPEHLIRYFHNVAEDARQIMASLGIRTFNELIGRVDLLDTDMAVRNWKSQGVDLTPLLSPAKKPYAKAGVFCCEKQDHGMDKVLDNTLIEKCKKGIEFREKVSVDVAIKNTDRTTGTMMSHEIAKRYGNDGLDADTITVNFKGSAGQSFGGWLSKGVTFNLEGDANDYVGKGLSGGKLYIYPPKNAIFKPEENIIIGNVAFYGATSGEAYIRGIAAERFCVRNSGAKVVVEGVGDHGCEYMTGGRVVIIGSTGRNFAAGMSGGIAYLWDPNKQIANNINLEMVALETLEDDDAADVKAMLENHTSHTGSAVSAAILKNWDAAKAEFVKVMPVEYKKVLLAEKEKRAEVRNG